MSEPWSDYAVGHKDGQGVTEAHYRPLIALADALAAAVAKWHDSQCGCGGPEYAQNHGRINQAMLAASEAYRQARQP